ncbi:hypothetical protein OG21DRAFT_1491211 [Imleria badia]|nr:hypothetical protein OG21DRAFT_1491211 [Imleria badia]
MSEIEEMEKKLLTERQEQMARAQQPPGPDVTAQVHMQPGTTDQPVIFASNQQEHSTNYSDELVAGNNVDHARDGKGYGTGHEAKEEAGHKAGEQDVEREIARGNRTSSATEDERNEARLQGRELTRKQVTESGEEYAVEGTREARQASKRWKGEEGGNASERGVVSKKCPEYDEDWMVEDDKAEEGTDARMEGMDVSKPGDGGGRRGKRSVNENPVERPTKKRSTTSPSSSNGQPRSPGFLPHWRDDKLRSASSQNRAPNKNKGQRVFQNSSATDIENSDRDLDELSEDTPSDSLHDLKSVPRPNLKASLPPMLSKKPSLQDNSAISKDTTAQGGATTCKPSSTLDVLARPKMPLESLSHPAVPTKVPTTHSNLVAESDSNGTSAACSAIHAACKPNSTVGIPGHPKTLSSCSSLLLKVPTTWNNKEDIDQESPAARKPSSTAGTSGHPQTPASRPSTLMKARNNEEGSHHEPTGAARTPSSKARSSAAVCNNEEGSYCEPAGVAHTPNSTARSNATVRNDEEGLHREPAAAACAPNSTARLNAAARVNTLSYSLNLTHISKPIVPPG